MFSRKGTEKPDLFLKISRGGGTDESARLALFVSLNLFSPSGSFRVFRNVVAVLRIIVKVFDL